MSSNLNKGLNKIRFISFASTILVIYLILSTGPISALTISVTTDKQSYVSDEIVEINIDIDVGDKEIVPFTDGSITIQGIDPSNSMFSSVCILANINEGLHPECSLQDNKFQSVGITYINSVFGYGERNATYETETYSWGYGYGVQGQNKIRISVKWKYPFEWSGGNYRALVAIKTESDILGRQPEFSSSTTFETNHSFGDIAYICRDDKCNYGIEKQMIQWLKNNGWNVDGKGYWSWDPNEMENYKLIVCSDELKACKLDWAHPAYNSHKNKQIPFLEIGDYPSISAARSFGYVKNYFAMSNSEKFYITQSDPIVEGYSGYVDVLVGTKFFVTQDYQLNSMAKDIGDSGNHDKTTFFKVEHPSRFAYVGWFGDKTPADLTVDGSRILNRLVNWLVCENIHGCKSIKPDETPPKITSFSPSGLTIKRRPLITAVTDEDSVCKGSINIDKEYDEMDLVFGGVSTVHTHRIMTPLNDGEYTVYMKCKDTSGNLMSDSFSWSFIVKVPEQKDVAYLCKDDSCNYGIEQQTIIWLEDNGWVTEGKGYLNWSEDELENYKLIVCSDELKACKLDWAHPAYNSHKNGMPFVEISDYPLLSAAKSFGYVKSSVGMKNSERLYITQTDEIVSGYSGYVNVLPSDARMIVTQDYQLNPMAKDIGDSGNHDKTTFFKVEHPSRFAYVGWFGDKTPINLLDDGNIILNRTISWAACGKNNC